MTFFDFQAKPRRELGNSTWEDVRVPVITIGIAAAALILLLSPKFWQKE